MSNKKASGRRTRRTHSPGFESKVAPAALRQVKTVADLCKEFDMHPRQINGWKRQLHDGAAGVLGPGRSSPSPRPSLLGTAAADARCCIKWKPLLRPELPTASVGSP
jgi:transposase-like protein